MEFLAGNTVRAAEVRRHLAADSMDKLTAEREMIAMKYIMETVPGWAHDQTAGGDTAQIIFEIAEPKWRWFHRPEFCPR